MTAPTMALVAICYDRWDFLARALPTWRVLAGAPPIFVGTYRDDTVPDWLDDAWVVSVDAEPFHLSRIRNCVATVAREHADPDYLVFIDADITVADGDVFARALVPEGTDAAPDFVVDSPFALADEYVILARDDPERIEPGKRGTAVVRTDLFFEIGGYDQRLIGWGIEDRNLYERLRDAGGRAGHYDRTAITHLEHAEELRYRHNPDPSGRLTNVLANLKCHMGSYDLHGAAWRDDLGYRDVRVRAPATDTASVDAAEREVGG